ncbi:Hsp20/alpha crystallin family protein [Allomuricauda sp. SCSIO 65647]|uniref:Hsp20/alpha crystallin family protein n=1 Tax=Allomuricauda sp. SCSIO 65647 TaxID=2908843 RepID=UPI001F255F47|nr:Hsp20/alpha crystallin family protein [Muricauda sp. SCSIO 65647]UJH66819.1 Hsp20/alpha crystallin family protein [Muricauda sp. SCSIO 65647]
MSIIRRNNLLFPSLMNEFFKPDWFGGMENFEKNVPAVNIKENEKDFELEFAIPGMKRDDFNVEVDDNILTVSSEVKNEKETKDKNYTRREFSYSSFKRSFTLPETVDEDNINASYVDGILRLALPKKEEALPKPKRMIEIG